MEWVRPPCLHLKDESRVIVEMDILTLVFFFSDIILTLNARIFIASGPLFQKLVSHHNLLMTSYLAV